MKATGSWLLAWGQKNLAPDTYERTMAAAWADLQHEIAHAPDAATARRLARSGRWLMTRVLALALAADRREARRGLRWWLLAAPLLAVALGLQQIGARGDGAAAAPQLIFLLCGLGLGALMAGTPRRVLTHEAPAAGWIAVLFIAALPLLGTSLGGSPRWLSLGPLHIHLATLMTPLLALALTQLWSERRLAHGLALLAAAQLALAVTRDPAATLTLSCIAVAVAAAIRRREMLLPALTLGGGALAFALASAPSLPAHGAPSALAVLALAGAILAPLALLRRRDAWTRGMSLAVALGLLAPLVASTFLDAPLPLVDFGGSAIVATYLGLGALLAVERGAAQGRSVSA